jgi:hypothetical protein
MEKGKDSTSQTSKSELALVDATVGDQEIRDIIRRILSNVAALVGAFALSSLPIQPASASPTTYSKVHRSQTPDRQRPPDHFSNVSDSKTPPKLKIPGLSDGEAAGLESAVRDPNPLGLKFTRSYNRSTTTSQDIRSINTTSQDPSKGARRHHISNMRKSGAPIPNIPRSSSAPTEVTSSESENVNLEIALTPAALFIVMAWIFRQPRDSKKKYKLLVKNKDGIEVDVHYEMEGMSEEKLNSSVIETYNKILGMDESLWPKPNPPWSQYRQVEGCWVGAAVTHSSRRLPPPRAASTTIGIACLSVRAYTHARLAQDQMRTRRINHGKAPASISSHSRSERLNALVQSFPNSLASWSQRFA